MSDVITRGLEIAQELNDNKALAGEVGNNLNFAVAVVLLSHVSTENSIADEVTENLGLEQLERD